jgi:hypothetical protein
MKASKKRSVAPQSESWFAGRGSRVAALVVLACVVLVAFGTRNKQSRPGATADSPDDPAAPPSPAAQLSQRGDPNPSAMASGSASAEPPAPPMTPEEARARAIEHAKRSLDIYKETMVFPLWSRPFDGSTRHLAEWNKPFPEGQPFAADKDRNEIRVDVVLDKLFAAPGEAITATVTVAYDVSGVPVEADTTAGHIVVYDESSQAFQPIPSGDVSFNEGPSGTYTASFTPSTFQALRDKQVEARFVTHVALGEFFKDVTEPFQYASEDVFTVRDIAVDRMTNDGSLEVMFDVNVSYTAPTLVEAVLYDATGSKGIVTYDDYITPTQTGGTKMSITFFGKAIRDSGINGPYSVRALHGHVKVPTADPPEVFWSRPATPVLMTHSYLASMFSDAPYSSPEKTAKIQLYQQTISDLQKPPQN